jgi:hypothetical protein
MSLEPTEENAELMTRFLLGQLSEEERREVEERFLADDEYFAQLLMVEDSLAEDYVFGRLKEEDQKNAELLFGSSKLGKSEVKFTEDLIAALRRAREAEGSEKRKNRRAVATSEITAPKTSRWLQSQGSLHLIAAGLQGLPKVFSATAALLVLLLVSASVYFVVQYQRQKRELRAQQATLERSVQETRQQLDAEMRKAAELAKRLDTETALRTQAEEAMAQSRTGEPRSLISLLLFPTTFERGPGAKTVTVTANTNRIQLVLAVPADAPYPNYNVLIKTFDGRQVWNRNSIPAAQIKQNKLSLTLSSSLLPYNDYRIELQGVAEDGAAHVVADYSFKVRK